MVKEPDKLVLPLFALAEISFKTTVTNVFEYLLCPAVCSPSTKSSSDPFCRLSKGSISHLTEIENVNVALSLLSSLNSEYVKDKIIFTAGPGGPLGPVGPSFPVKPYSKTEARLEKNYIYNYIIVILLIITSISFKTYPQSKL